ncbi:peptidase M4 family protein [Saccharopolyspora rhizosphaerae]|uniref:Neutral metalloproteinase n=1 Tax=Saccharopolyspora rhizosphaerae TaxID=2492662 RepID=A0A3R8QPM7_9PSEU|nr:M4 family metallopeptidase [Saccharopolyspora rhizosphaerae]RRO17005.1 peptidase M4 family protein [Saccharopolyspora rhizosphaerae]
MNTSRHPIQCLIPDYVLVEIAKQGDAEEREAALNTLAVSTTLRSARSQAEAARMAAGPAVVATQGLREPAVDRIIRDAKNTRDTGAPIVRKEGDPPVGDAAVDEAYDHFGHTWTFLFEVLARNSIDNAGMTLDGVVHYGKNVDNAFWDGDQMLFGDGSGTWFTRMTKSLTVAAHELGHGVIQCDGPLVYQGESGALNEHLADVFGVMVHQWLLGQTAEDADWLVGAEILAEGVQGRALRSMKDPGTAYDDPKLGKDRQPAHMKDLVITLEDNRGVHINSGIPNRAFYETAIALGGFSWERAGRIHYATLGHPQLRPNSDFRRFARLNHRVATQMYGANSTEADAVAHGWNAVGVEL